MVKTLQLYTLTKNKKRIQVEGMSRRDRSRSVVRQSGKASRRGRSCSAFTIRSMSTWNDAVLRGGTVRGASQRIKKRRVKLEGKRQLYATTGPQRFARRAKKGWDKN